MTTTLLAHAGHHAARVGGTGELTGVLLLLLGAATALWWANR